MSDYNDALLTEYREAYAELFAKLLEVEAELTLMRRALAVVSTPATTDAQMRARRDALLLMQEGGTFH